MGKFTKAAEVSLVLSGKVVTAPELVSKYGSTKVLCVTLESKRLSGVVDRFSIHFPNTLGVVLTEGQHIELNGDIRSVNAKDSDRVIYPFVMANAIRVLDEEPAEYKNEVEIDGAELVSFDGVRASYTDESKALATYRIRVSRKHSRCAYFRVTTWGRDAIFLGNIYKSVERLHLKCRLQSYISKQSNRLRFGLVSFYLEVPSTKKESTAEGEKPVADEPAVESPEPEQESPSEVAEEVAKAESEVSAGEEETVQAT